MDDSRLLYSIELRVFYHLVLDIVFYFSLERVYQPEFQERISRPFET
jgi:hypothetical protein